MRSDASHEETGVRGVSAVNLGRFALTWVLEESALAEMVNKQDVKGGRRTDRAARREEIPAGGTASRGPAGREASVAVADAGAGPGCCHRGSWTSLWKLGSHWAAGGRRVGGTELRRP